MVSVSEKDGGRESELIFFCGCCRDDQSVSHLLKVEIVMEGPTYYIVFVDADEVPPPIRIDNLAEVGTTINLD